MKSVQDQYRNAPHYDYEYTDVGDLHFWFDEVLNYTKSRNILEFCCGTGRITLPLLGKGLCNHVTVTGVDVTPAMLNIAKQKAEKLPEELRQSLRLIEGDMRSVDVGKGKYDLVLIPFNSFLHMLTLEDQLAALQNSYDHLKPGGYFIADIFTPSVERLARNVGPSWLEVEKTIRVETEGILLVRSGSFSYSLHDQILTALWQYQVFELGEGRTLLKTYWSPLEIRVIFPGEWILLLERVGFKIVKKMGSFDRQPFDASNSDRMLFLCQKPS